MFNRGQQISVPESSHKIGSGKCSSCNKQFDVWGALINHLAEVHECQDYYTRKFVNYCFICSRPFKWIRSHLHDILSGKTLCPPDEMRMHDAIKPLYVQYMKPKQTGKRSKKRVIRKTQAANSSDEDESFRVKKRCRKDNNMGHGSPCASKMIEQVIEGKQTLLQLKYNISKCIYKFLNEKNTIIFF